MHGFVARQDIKKITGGTITAGTLAHLDSKGIGIKHTLVGGRIMYHIEDVIEWLKNNTILVNFDE